MDVVNEATERIGRAAASVAAVQVDDGGVDVSQVDDLGLLVPVLVQDSVSTDEEEDPDSHDQRPQDLQPVRVEIPAETAGQSLQKVPAPPPVGDVVPSGGALGRPEASLEDRWSHLLRRSVRNPGPC